MDRLSTRTIDALHFVHQFLRLEFSFSPLKRPGYEKGLEVLRDLDLHMLSKNTFHNPNKKKFYLVLYT